MSNVVEALKLIRDDCDKARKAVDDGTPLKSFIQRTGKTIDELDDMFDPSMDEADDSRCRAEGGPGPQHRLYRRRIAFLRGSLKEFHEDFDDKVSDVDFMRLMSAPFADAKFPVTLAIEEMEKEQE